MPDVGLVADLDDTSVRPAAAAAVTTRAPSAANSCGSIRPPVAFRFVPPPSSASNRIGCPAKSAINNASVASSISNRNSWRTTAQPIDVDERPIGAQRQPEPRVQTDEHERLPVICAICR